MGETSRQRIRVGALLLIALAVLAAGIVMIGDQNHMFTRKNTYYASFTSVSGLNPGNPVQLNGVAVGNVKAIVLPEDPTRSQIRIEITVERRFAERVRENSEARIKTLGLLGDKYVQLTSGSPQFPIIPDGAEIPTAAPTSVDALVATGEDVMANVTEISSSLRTILKRMEEGEGLLGELTTESQGGQKVVDAALETLASVQSLSQRLQHGKGTVSRLINDPAIADSLTLAIERLNGTLLRIEEGEGLLAMLINDPEGPKKLDATLTAIQGSAEAFANFTSQVEEAEGLLPKLLTDAEYSAKISSELESILSKLNQLADKLNGDEGTVPQLLNDPQVYESINDILVGVNESKFLRWLIRNRQKKGIEKRYQEELEAAPPGTPKAKALGDGE